MLTITPILQNSPKHIRDLPLELIKFVLRDPTKTEQEYDDWMQDKMIWVLNSSTTSTNKSFMEQLNLAPVYQYPNNDLAFYSYKDKKIYDYSMELGTFIQLYDDEYWRDMGRAKPTPIDYKIWIHDVMIGNHKNAGV